MKQPNMGLQWLYGILSDYSAFQPGVRRAPKREAKLSEADR